MFRGLGFPQFALSAVQGDRASIRGPVSRAYRWPLRHLSDRAGPLALARMVPSSLEHPSMPALRRGEAWLHAFVAGGGAAGFRVRVSATRSSAGALARHVRAFPTATVTRARRRGTFLQEEVPAELAAAIRDVAGRSGML